MVVIWFLVKHMALTK